MLSFYMHYCENQRNRREKAVSLSKHLFMAMNENTNYYTQWLCITSRQEDQESRLLQESVSLRSFSLSTDQAVSERLSWILPVQKQITIFLLCNVLQVTPEVQLTESATQIFPCKTVAWGLPIMCNRISQTVPTVCTWSRLLCRIFFVLISTFNKTINAKI